MRQRLAWGAAFYMVGLFIILAAPVPWQMWQRHVEASTPIYETVEKVQIARGPDSIVWTGVSRKLQPCTVVAGSPVTLTAYWLDDEGQINPLSYPAARPTGESVVGAPLVTNGGGFVVGPWVIHDKPETISRVVRVSQFMHCTFPSGIERRDAEIGPITIP